MENKENMEGDLKYGIQNKAKSLDRRSKTETAFNVPFGDDSVDNMIVIGRSFPVNKSRSSTHPLHSCYSDTSIKTLQSNPQHKDSFPNEGFCLGVSEQPSVSSISFASAISDLCSETLLKKLHEMESEISGKNATISFLKKQLNKDGDSNIEFTSVGVETDWIGTTYKEYLYQSKLNELNSKVEKREKTISELARELEENNKMKAKQIEENRHLSHEINLLNRQLRSMYELVQSKHWDSGIDPEEFHRCKESVAELKENLSKRDILIAELEGNLKRREIEVDSKDKLLRETTKKFSEYKKSSLSEMNEMKEKVVMLEKHARNQEEWFTVRIMEAQKNMEDELVSITERLEAEYQKDLRKAIEHCQSSFKKLSEMPKTKLENIFRICESGKLDSVLLHIDLKDQKALLEKKLSDIGEEKKKEVNQIIEGYESKISSLKSQMDSLYQQLKERKETLDTFETELMTYRKEKEKWQNGQQSQYNFNELKQLHTAEIQSQQEKHKLEKDFLQDRLKQLTEEILIHADNEKFQLQELQSAKQMAATFREKYELLLGELESKISAKNDSDFKAKVIELELEDSLSEFKGIILALKKAEEIHEDKIRYLKTLDEDELVIREKEITCLQAKLDQVDRFQMRLFELDGEVKELIKILEDRYTATVESLNKTHYNEVKLKELELSAVEQQMTDEISDLRGRVKELEDANEKLSNEIRRNKIASEKEMNLLKHQAEELAVELLGNEGMMAIKNEIEETLTNRIQQLESFIEMKSRSSQKELEKALSRCIMMEAMVSAKEEIARECENWVKENEKIVSRSTEQADEIEKHCSKLEESLQKLEDITEVLFDMNNCENFFMLKKKVEHLSVGFLELSDRCKNIDDEREQLSQNNENLIKENNIVTHKLQELTAERDTILQNFRSVEEEMKQVMQRSRDFERDLLTVMRESKEAEAMCDEVIEKSIIGEIKADNLLEKVGQICDAIGKAFPEKEGVLKSYKEDREEKTEGFMEGEHELKEQRNEILAQNHTLRENIKILNERVDLLLVELVGTTEIEINGQTSSTQLISSTCEDVTLKKNSRASSTEVKFQENNQEWTEMRTSFREKMMFKLENIRREMSEAINEKNELIEKVETLEEENFRVKKELKRLAMENYFIRKKLTTAFQEMGHGSKTTEIEESFMKGIKVKDMKKEMENLSDYIKSLNCELDQIKRDNKKFMCESRHHLKSLQYIKDELEKTWPQHSDVEEQLDKLRRENAVLNLHRDQLEQTNKEISNLISDGTPSVVSWIKIHETVENIVDDVQALKASFTDLNTECIKSEDSKSRTDFKTVPKALHLELEHKTKLCQELISQKAMLEKELENVETLMKQSKDTQCYNEIPMERSEEQYHEKQSGSSIVGFLPESLTQDGMNLLNPNNENPYLETLHRLKKHFQDQVHMQEVQLTEALVNEIEGLKREIQQLEGDQGDGLAVLTKRHKDEMQEMKRGHEIELEKLRHILKEMIASGDNTLLIHEIESKHGQQMEELRMYFEKKCAELEKNFSEDVFSRHSRNISNAGDVVNEEPLENKNNSYQNSDIILKYRLLLEEEEGDADRRMKYLSYIIEIVNSHAEEMNCMKTKHDKEMANLRTRLEQLKEEFEELRKSAEEEKESLIMNYEKKLSDVAMEERSMIAAELKREFDNRMKAEMRRLSLSLQAETKCQEMESVNLAESCVEKLSVYQTESAMRKVETERELEKTFNKKDEDKFRRELEEEKVKIAEHYKNLNEAALTKFNEEQESLIKSHSEMILRLIQEHEEKIAELKNVHKRDLEKFHCDEENKRTMEFRDKERKFEKELSSMKSTYEDELYELKRCCQDMLNEQVSLAKSDAFNTLQKQIQDYLNGKDEDGPTSKEVIELGEKFAGKYRREIDELKQRHLGEVARIRTEYEEKIRRRYSTGSLPKKSIEKMEMKTDDDKLQILRERDALQEMVSSLRHVLSELIRYVGTCEDELNNTIVCEFGKNEETVYRSFIMNSTELNETNCSSITSKKVHFAPDLSNIISEMSDNQSLNTTLQVRAELDRCLKQLKNDASHLLALSNPARKQDENLYQLLLKLEEEKNHLAEKVFCLEEMQKDLKMEQTKTKGKLAELERTREIVSEGYGEEVVNAEKQENLIKLKEKARSLMGQSCSQSSDLLNVLDEICKAGDKLQEEARREKNDLQLQGSFSLSGTEINQVDAADKQLRATRKFLEEQAAEREIERDDYTNEIKRLKEALRVRERDRSLQDMMNEEIKPTARRRFCKVEALENQLKETSTRLVALEQSKADVDNQLKEAVDKIWTLREIIRDLEGQIVTLSEGKASLECKIEDFESANEEQAKINRSLTAELENVRILIRDEYAGQIKNLEEELGVLRRAAESLNPEAVAQIRINLREIELALTKKTKDLEQLYVTSANVSCSSPSEDISISERLDITGCPTPDEMQNLESQKIGLPVDEIDRINEKLMRHTRAEEVAIKTVRDLKMQLKTSRKTIEELQIERDVLFERADKYLQENSRLKVRLDEQRCNAGIMQRQLSADLESQIKRLELDIEKLNDLCLQKDKQIRDMNIILEQTMKSLKIREAEVLNRSNEESETITNLKTELQNALEEKRKLEETIARMKETIRDTVTVPFLIDSMLEEKNAEIDRLEKEVARLSRQRATSSLIRTSSDSNNSSKSLKKVKFSEPDSFVQFISPILSDEQSVMRCASDSYADLKISTQKLRRPNYHITTPESLSSIGPLQLSPRGAESHLYWSNSHAVLMSSPKELEINNSEPVKDQVQTSESQTAERSNLDAELDEIRVQLKSTMDAVEQDKSFYKKELEKMLECESKLRSELDSKKRKISELLLEVDTLRRKLAEMNFDAENGKSERQKLEGELMTKDEEIKKLNSNTESLLMTMETLKRNHLEEVEELQNKLNFEHNRVESVLEELKILEVKKVEIEEEFLSLKEDYNEKLNSQQEAMSHLESEIAKLNQKNNELVEINESVQAQMEATLVQADKLSKELADELLAVKNENDQLKNDYVNLKRDLENYMTQMMEKAEVGMQAKVETSDEHCQTGEELIKAEINEEVSEFQVNIDNLKLELCAWEQKMDGTDFDKDEALSYAAIVRTLISCIIENLDDHFFELQTYRRKIMECSVDDLTDKVQKELMLSAKLDNKLLSNFQSDMKNQSNYGEEQASILENGGGDNNLSLAKKKQNLVNLTVRLCELETNLQDMEIRNKEFETQIASLKYEKDEEKRRADGLQILVKLLEDNLTKERAKLAEERNRCDEDAKITEVLKTNFELFVERVDELERALTTERQLRMTLENLIKKPTDTSDNSTTLELKCQLEIEQQKCLSLNLIVEKEKKKNQELKIQLEQEKLERLSDKDVQRLLSRDLALLQEQKDNLETQLAFARELLQKRQSEVVALKRKINLQEIDIKALSISTESQHEKEAEISMMSEKLTDLKKELDYYRKQMEGLNDKSENVSAPLLMKMKILNNCVEEHVQVTNEMGEALLHLTQETEQMRSAIKKIEETTENGALSNSSDETILADMETERKTWMAEKERLTDEVEKAKSDYEVLKKDSIEIFKSNDTLKLEIKKLKKEVESLREELANAEQKQLEIPEDCVLHLFGKYMKTESFRKALAYQKTYLTRVLQGYEGTEEEAIAKLMRGGSSRRKELRRRHRSKRKKLKTAALVIVAIKRMQFMVARWRICRLSAFNALMGQQERASNKENEHRKQPLSGLHLGPIDPLRYQTHNFLRQQLRSQENASRTPPSRDMDSRRPLDTRKITEGIERFNYLQKNVVLPSRPP